MRVVTEVTAVVWVGQCFPTFLDLRQHPTEEKQI